MYVRIYGYVCTHLYIYIHTYVYIYIYLYGYTFAIATCEFVRANAVADEKAGVFIVALHLFIHFHVSFCWSKKS